MTVSSTQESIYTTYSNGVASYVRISTSSAAPDASTNEDVLKASADDDADTYIQEWAMTVSAGVRHYIEWEGMACDAHKLWFSNYWDSAFGEVPVPQKARHIEKEEGNLPDQKIRDFLAGIFSDLLMPQAKKIEADATFISILQGKVASDLRRRLEREADRVIDTKPATLLWTSLTTTNNATSSTFAHAYPFGLWVARLSDQFFCSLWLKHYELNWNDFDSTGKSKWKDWTLLRPGDDIQHAKNYWSYQA